MQQRVPLLEAANTTPNRSEVAMRFTASAPNASVASAGGQAATLRLLEKNTSWNIDNTEYEDTTLIARISTVWYSTVINHTDEWQA